MNATISGQRDGAGSGNNLGPPGPQLNDNFNGSRPSLMQESDTLQTMTLINAIAKGRTVYSSDSGTSLAYMQPHSHTVSIHALRNSNYWLSPTKV